MTNPAFEDGFNLLCGEKIGAGGYRDVFNCRIRDDLVVKVEVLKHWREFHNVREMQFWCDHQHSPNIARWLAPCEYMSPDGRILLQRRVQPIRDTDKLPDKLPTFLTDIKRENFGWLDKKLVCVDYGYVITTPSIRMRKATW